MARRRYRPGVVTWAATWFTGWVVWVCYVAKWDAEEMVAGAVAAVLGTTYFVAVAVWRNDPGRMEGFLSTTIGQWLVAATLVLQALGIAWASYLTRFRT